MREAPAPRDCSGARCAGDGLMPPPLRLAGGSSAGAASPGLIPAAAAAASSRWTVIELLRALVCAVARSRTTPIRGELSRAIAAEDATPFADGGGDGLCFGGALFVAALSAHVGGAANAEAAADTALTLRVAVFAAPIPSLRSKDGAVRCSQSSRDV